MPKNALNTFFLKFLFFALYSFSLPPKHFLIIFSENLRPKMVIKKSLKDKNKFSFFYIFISHFPSPLTEKKTKPLTFSALFVTGNRKNARENVPLKIFFLLFFFSFFAPNRSWKSEKLLLTFFFEIPT